MKIIPDKELDLDVVHDLVTKLNTELAKKGLSFVGVLADSDGACLPIVRVGTPEVDVVRGAMRRVGLLLHFWSRQPKTNINWALFDSAKRGAA